MPKRRSMDAVREDMTVVEEMEEDAEVRTEWRCEIHCGDSRRETPKAKEVRYLPALHRLDWPATRSVD